MTTSINIDPAMWQQSNYRTFKGDFSSIWDEAFKTFKFSGEITSVMDGAGMVFGLRVKSRDDNLETLVVDNTMAMPRVFCERGDYVSAITDGPLGADPAPRIGFYLNETIGVALVRSDHEGSLAWDAALDAHRRSLLAETFDPSILRDQQRQFMADYPFAAYQNPRNWRSDITKLANIVSRAGLQTNDDVLKLYYQSIADHTQVILKEDRVRRPNHFGIMMVRIIEFYLISTELIHERKLTDPDAKAALYRFPL